VQDLQGTLPPGCWTHDLIQLISPFELALVLARSWMLTTLQVESDSVFEVDASAFVAHIHPEGEEVVVPGA
jgi:hypothetical protein